MEDGKEPLELIDEQEVGFADELEPVVDDDQEETVIGFADEAEEGEPETPLIKKLRDQLRDMQRQLRTKPAAVNDADPEPVVPPIKRVEEFDYDSDRHADYLENRDAAVLAKAEWQRRQGEREDGRKRASEDQTRQIEQQRRSLGVGDYDQRAAVVQDRLSEGQLAVLINGADNPAQMIYALGRSVNKLDQLAGEENLAKFAVAIGKLERDIKVQKRKAPAPESQVRGATASLDMSNDKELARLERDADKSGDRSKVIAYKRTLRAA